MADSARLSFVRRIRRYLVAGVLSAIPVLVTWLVVKFLFNLLADVGVPVVDRVATTIEPSAPAVAALLKKTVFRGILGVSLVFVLLCILGWIGTRLAGRKLIAGFDSLVNRIPLVKTVYGSVKTLVTALQGQPEEVQRVVLIDFPSEEMKAVGFVTRTLTDTDTGRKLAAVYVPTTPNPTSGYLEIVPVERITSTTWTFDEAMSFIVSGGAVAPPEMNYDKSAAAPPAAERQPEIGPADET
ncbi:MAG: DUF502 domain-containing protein [Planctomycetota bacterium]